MKGEMKELDQQKAQEEAKVRVSEHVESPKAFKPKIPPFMSG